MTRAIEIREPALEDIDAAGRWYEGQDEGLGDEFLAELERVLDRVAALPGQFPQHHGSVRRALLRRFPYAVIFDVTERRHERGTVLDSSTERGTKRGRSSIVRFSNARSICESPLDPSDQDGRRVVMRDARPELREAVEREEHVLSDEIEQAVRHEEHAVDASECEGQWTNLARAESPLVLSFSQLGPHASTTRPR